MTKKDGLADGNEPSKVTCERRRTRRFPRQRWQGLCRLPRAPAPTARVQPAGLRSEFRQSDPVPFLPLRLLVTRSSTFLKRCSRRDTIDTIQSNEPEKSLTTQWRCQISINCQTENVCDKHSSTIVDHRSFGI